MPHEHDDPDAEILRMLAAEGVALSEPRVIEFFIDALDEASANSIERALTKAGWEAEAEFDEGEPEEEIALYHDGGDDDEDTDLDDFDDEEGDDEDDDFGPSWTVWVNVTMVPELAEIRRIQGELEDLVSPLGGRVDGWGTPME